MSHKTPPNHKLRISEAIEIKAYNNPPIDHFYELNNLLSGHVCCLHSLIWFSKLHKFKGKTI